MSIYHCNIKMVGRTGGKSAVAASAYRSGEKLYDEETGLIHDFTRKGGVVMLRNGKFRERGNDRGLGTSR